MSAAETDPNNSLKVNNEAHVVQCTFARHQAAIIDYLLQKRYLLSRKDGTNARFNPDSTQVQSRFNPDSTQVEPRLNGTQQ